MAISVVDTTTASVNDAGASANHTCNKPAGVVAGDVLIASVQLGTGTPLDTGPTGWVCLEEAHTLGSNSRTSLWWKLAGGSEPASYTWTGTSSRYSIVITAIRGTDGAAPNSDPGTVANMSPGGTMDAPTLTPASVPALLVCTYGNVADSTPTPGAWSTPTGMTHRGTAAVAGASATALFTEARAAGGATGVRTSTYTGSSAANGVGFSAMVVEPPATNVTPAAVVETQTVPSPTITTTASPEPAAVAETQQVPSPAVAVTGTATPGAVDMPMLVPAVTVLVGTPVPIGAAVAMAMSIPVPTITASATATPATVVETQTVPAPEFAGPTPSPTPLTRIVYIPSALTGTEVPVPADWNGLGHATVAFARMIGANLTWFRNGIDGSVAWGTTGDIPVPGPWVTPGVIDIAVFRPSVGRWYVLPNGVGVAWGSSVDIPVEGNWSGTGLYERAVWRTTNFTWFVDDGSGSVAFGGAGDIPAPGDWTGDGLIERGVYRPSDGRFFMAGQPTANMGGQTTDLPVPGRYSGAVDQAALWRPSNGAWIVHGVGTVAYLGQPGDVPVPADWDGDGFTEPAVYRPSTGEWLIAGDAYAPPAAVAMGMTVPAPTISTSAVPEPAAVAMAQVVPAPTIMVTGTPAAVEITMLIPAPAVAGDTNVPIPAAVVMAVAVPLVTVSTKSGGTRTFGDGPDLMRAGTPYTRIPEHPYWTTPAPRPYRPGSEGPVQ